MIGRYLPNFRPTLIFELYEILLNKSLQILKRKFFQITFDTIDTNSPRLLAEERDHPSYDAHSTPPPPSMSVECKFHDRSAADDFRRSKNHLSFPGGWILLTIKPFFEVREREREGKHLKGVSSRGGGEKNVRIRRSPDERDAGRRPRRPRELEVYTPNKLL